MDQVQLPSLVATRHFGCVEQMAGNSIKPRSMGGGFTAAMGGSNVLLQLSALRKSEMLVLTFEVECIES